jgi:mono/diheme cytochrome c family protein
MVEREHSEPIKLYLDDDAEPFKIAPAPLTFQFNTIALPDGPHRLRIEASNGLAPPTLKVIPFTVRNGVAITVSGLEKEQTIAGQVQMVINAYAGSTEVDFQPRRAETPQPIPTWAWVVFLAVIAWTMYYVVTPQVESSASVEMARHHSPEEGARVYSDTCARCHGETGLGLAPKVPPLLDAQIALAPTPAPLLMKVTASTQGSMMPEWGTRLTNEEIVGVVNHVRHSWGHDSSEIQLSHRNPPEGIDLLHRRISRALKARDLSDLMLCCAQDGGLQPQIFRTDGVDQRGALAVRSAWANYFEALAESRAAVTQISLPDARYDYDPATVDQDGSVVIATGRLFLETKNDQGRSDIAKGRFIRIYQLVAGTWQMVFDFADIPMAVGCVPGTVICPPEGGGPAIPASAPGALTTTGNDVETPAPPGPPPGVTPGSTPAATGDAIGYADVQQYFRDLGKEARSAPHETFWEFPYRKFVDLVFPIDWGEAATYRSLVVGSSAASNLIRALKDGKGIVVDHPDGTTTIKDDLGRMPKGGPYMPDDRIAKIAAWIDAGCPELPGGPGLAAPAAPAGDRTPSPIGYADVQAILAGLGKEARSAPHETFWQFSREQFVNLVFPIDWGEDASYRCLVVGDSAASNLIKALRDGKGIVVDHPDGTTTIKDDLGRMPKGGPYVADEDVAKIAAWIDAGCPESAGEVGEIPGASAPAPGQPAQPAPPAAVPGFPAPSQPGGFPPPAPQQPGGFPPPAPQQPGGFPPPAPPKEDAPAPGGFPPPAPPKESAPVPGGFPPPSPPKQDGPVPGGFPPPAPSQDPEQPPKKAPQMPPGPPPAGER